MAYYNFVQPSCHPMRSSSQSPRPAHGYNGRPSSWMRDPNTHPAYHGQAPPMYDHRANHGQAPPMYGHPAYHGQAPPMYDQQAYCGQAPPMYGHPAYSSSNSHYEPDAMIHSFLQAMQGAPEATHQMNRSGCCSPNSQAYNPRTEKKCCSPRQPNSSGCPQNRGCSKPHCMKREAASKPDPKKEACGDTQADTGKSSGTKTQRDLFDDVIDLMAPFIEHYSKFQENLQRQGCQKRCSGERKAQGKKADLRCGLSPLDFIDTFLAEMMAEDKHCDKREATSPPKQDEKKPNQSEKPRKGETGGDHQEQYVMIPTRFGPVVMKVKKGSPVKNHRKTNDAKKTDGVAEKGNKPSKADHEEKHGPSAKGAEPTTVSSSAISETQGSSKQKDTDVKQSDNAGNEFLVDRDRIQQDRVIKQEKEDHQQSDANESRLQEDKEVTEEELRQSGEDFVILGDTEHNTKDTDIPDDADEEEVEGITKYIVAEDEDQDKVNHEKELDEAMADKVADITKHIVAMGNDDDEDQPNSLHDYIVELPKEWSVTFDLSGYEPKEISVNTSGRRLVVQAEHEEETEDGPVFEEFRKTITLPADVDPDTVTTTLNDDGVLHASATRS